MKEDLQCSPAELEYGRTQRLPQEFVTSRQTTMHQREFVSKLKDHFKSIQPTQTRDHSENPFVDRILFSCERVFIFPKNPA